ncbi:MAG: multidrug effflux MFS transporter [Alphaproteobacteria bacterium]|nr:multidrug effflux MFS transporter [Alphaproteobacteria bacterium]
MSISIGRHTIGKKEFIALVAQIMALNAVALDIMLPAFPQIGEGLRVSNPNDIQYVLTAYLVGFGVGQLLLGPISDRYGRRIPLLIGLSLYVVAAIAAAFSPGFATLIALRVVQGLGAASTRIIAIAAVRDTFSGRAMAEVMSLVFMVFMVVPIIAPALGQLIVLAGPWQWIFAAMALMGLLVMGWAFVRLPETLAPENRRPLSVAAISGGFTIVFSNRVAMMYGLAPGVLLGALFGFLNTAQPIYGEIYGLGPLFPFAFASVGMVMAVSSLINARIVGRFGMRPVSHSALIGFIALSGVWFVWSLLGTIPFWPFLLLMAAIMFLFSLIATNFNAMSMDPLGEVAGTASSVFGFMQTAGGALLGAIIGAAFDGTTLWVGAGYFVAGLIALAMVLVAENGKLFETRYEIT